MLSFPSYFIGGSIILDIISVLIEKYDIPTPKINYDDITSNQYDQTNNENNIVTIYEDNSFSSKFKKLNIFEIIGLKLIIFAIVIYYLFPIVYFGFSDAKLPETANLTKNDYTELKINMPEDYTGFSKQKIYNIRETAVKNSIFYTKDYKPNEDIFGGIESGKHWWGIKSSVCSYHKDKTPDNTKGVSTVSKYIENPDLLVTTMFPFSNFIEYDKIGYCTAEYPKLIPTDLWYIKDKNLIVAKFPIDKKMLKARINWQGHTSPYFLNLTGLNARDFGYNYIFASKLTNINMMEYDNISKDDYLIRDYIHVGGSCKYPGGCNNISPHQTEFDYNINNLPAEITLKLWKKKPITPYKKADFYVRLVFEEL
jgi:hypothetical protein